MKKFKLIISFVLALTFIISACTLLASCSQKEKLYLFSLGDYIDPDVLDAFESEYGIEVVCDEFTAPEDMYAKFTSGTVKYDLICTSDYMIEKLIGEDRLDTINYDNIPNFANIEKRQIDATKYFDPEVKYTVPHFWGTLGILYNTEKVSEEEAASWDVLFDTKYAGNVIMPDSMRDAMFVALKKLGYDGNTTDKAQLDEAAALLKKQDSDGLVQAYLMDEAAREKIVSENADMAVVYNGEAYLAFEENDKLAFTVPSEGTYIWLDSFAIPKNAENKEAAEKFLNFLCSKEIAAKNFEYIYYSTPNKAVIDSLDAEILSEKAIFPDEDIYEDIIVFKYLGKETEEYYTKLWKDIKS